MKNYSDYFYSNEKEYHFKIKIAEEVTTESLDKLETALEKYELISMTKPSKAIMQKSPRDFYNVENAEIYTFEATVKYPVNDHTVQQLVYSTLQIPEKHVVVFNEGDPNRDIEDAIIEDSEKTYTPVMNSDYEDEDNSELVGEKRRDSLLKELEKSRKFKADYAEKPTIEFEIDAFTKMKPNNQSPMSGKSAKEAADKVGGLFNE